MIINSGKRSKAPNEVDPVQTHLRILRISKNKSRAKEGPSFTQTASNA